MQQIFYITLDPERAIGIEDFFPSYHIIHSEPSQLTDPIFNSGVDIKHFPTEIDSTHQILESEKVQKYIKSNSFGVPDILVFKNDKNIETICKNLGYNLINPNSDISRKYENKIEFARFIENIEIFKKPKFEVIEKVSDMDYATLSSVFGSEFVVQFYFGHSGNSTFFIDSKESLEQIKSKYPLRKGKVSKKVQGVPYTINACITKLGVVIGGISEQITGLKFLTSSKGGTVGNDFTQRHLNEELRKTLISKTMEFGEILQKEGHKGIFGLDLILEESTNEFYLIEANIRQTMSCGYFSYLQRDQRQVPIMLWHILELLDFDYNNDFLCLDTDLQDFINHGIQEFKNTQDKLELNIRLNQPMNASQVFFRNRRQYPVKITDPFPSGIYRMRGRLPDMAASLEEHDKYPAVYRLREDGFSTLCFIKRGYNILEAKIEGGVMIYAAPDNAVVSELGELGRIQVLESAFSSREGNDLSGWIIDVIKAIEENVSYEEAEKD